MLNGDGPDKRMIDMAGAVADFAYKQGIGDAVAVDQLIQSYRGLRAEVERLRSEVLDLAEAASTACRDAATAEAEVRRLSDAVRERPIRHLPVNGPDDRQPNAPDRGQPRDAATPTSDRGRSSEQDENHEAGIEAAHHAWTTRHLWSDRERLEYAIAAYLSRASAPPPERDT